MVSLPNWQQEAHMHTIPPATNLESTEHEIIYIGSTQNY